jgi:hypothetical protein
VSTVGLIPEMKRFVAESRAVMAVSLHATTDEVRDWICPVNRKYGLQVREWLWLWLWVWLWVWVWVCVCVCV